MKWLIGSMTAVLLGVGPIQADVDVVVGNIELHPWDANANPGFEPYANYWATVYEDAAGTDPTSVWFVHNGTDLEIVSWNLDDESDWYLVQRGDTFSRDTINRGLFPVLFTTEHPRPPVSIGTEDFYLGVNASTFRGDRDVFGWVEIGNSPDGLVQLDDATAYGVGIIVGTTSVVSEPGALCLLLLAAGSGLLAYRLRRQSPLVRKE